MELVAAKLPLETSSEIVESNLGNATLALLRYVPERLREAARARLVASAWRAVETARDDLQLVWLRGLLGLVAEADDLARVERLMDGGEAIEGVVLDQPLRWTIVKRLVAWGRPGAAERLAAESARDPSDKGRKSAFEAEVARPTREAKERAWRLFTGAAAEDRALEGGEPPSDGPADGAGGEAGDGEAPADAEISDSGADEGDVADDDVPESASA